jgi:hypothetical protein
MKLTKKDTLHNHFVSQVYLKGFSDGTFVHCADKNIPNNWYSTKKPVEVGFKDKLYSQYTEDQLSLLEQLYPESIKKIKGYFQRPKKSPITIKEVKILIDFLSVQVFRVPKMKDKIGELIEQAKSENFFYNNVPDFREVLDSTVYNQQAFFEGGIYNLNYIVRDLLINCSWTIIRSTCKTRFVTNDTGHGMCIETSSPNKLGLKGLGFGTSDTYIFFPLSKEYCLWINTSQKETTQGFKEIHTIDWKEDKTVHFVNGVLFADAAQYIFGSSQGQLKNAVEKANELLPNHAQDYNFS